MGHTKSILTKTLILARLRAPMYTMLRHLDQRHRRSIQNASKRLHGISNNIDLQLLPVSTCQYKKVFNFHFSNIQESLKIICTHRTFVTKHFLHRNIVLYSLLVGIRFYDYYFSLFTFLYVNNSTALFMQSKYFILVIESNNIIV